eukprot:Seg6460.2 transcript_id=Seg6460.2/GoldUCD/mRNA.D3Y31 product="Protein PRY1" protein_id=Seg6460.2/GoldUCD/D3Y31
MKLAIVIFTCLFVAITGQTIKREKDLCLHAHNVLRSLHENTGPMVWDDQLTRGAEEWARKLVNERGLRHSRGNYGENLYAAWGQSASCAKATLSWYSEIKDYDFNRGGYKSGTGHFTQIVWKGSTRLGVGIATKGSKVVVVARYSPAGNFMRRFREHVHRQKPGARVPSLSELENGSVKPRTDGPPMPQTNRPNPPPPEPTQGPGPNPQPGTNNLCLHAHNVLRALHQNTGQMVWDDELARGSEQYARQLASEGGLRHSRGNYGENLYAAWGQSASCAKATLSWYNEIKDYNFNRGGYQSGTGHFTQLIWKGSTRLGAGVAKRGNMVVVVARYAPRGNFMGRFAEHVHRQNYGARVPSLGEIESGVTNPSTGGPPVPPRTRGPRPEPPPTNCKDQKWKCRYFRSKCNRVSWIRDMCKKTCGVC